MEIEYNQTKMKAIKIIIVGVIVISTFFLAFHKPDTINIEGKWKANKIILDGRQTYPMPTDPYLQVKKEIVIDDWTNTIKISGGGERLLIADFKVEKDDKGNFYVRLSSKEKALNGNFDLKIDTTNFGPQWYIINLKLQFNKTQLYLQREVNVPPWNPEKPHRGQV